MTPRERDVVRAVIRSLRANVHVDMDAFATSYAVPDSYIISRPKIRAARLLEALINAKEGK